MSVLLISFSNLEEGRERERISEVNKNDWHTVESNMNLARFNFDLNSTPNVSFKVESSPSSGCKRRNDASFQNVLSRDTVLLKKKSNQPKQRQKKKQYTLDAHAHMLIQTAPYKC